MQVEDSFKQVHRRSMALSWELLRATEDWEVFIKADEAEATATAAGRPSGEKRSQIDQKERKRTQENLAEELHEEEKATHRFMRLKAYQQEEQVKEVAEACQRYMTLVRTPENKTTKTCRRCGAQPLDFVKHGNAIRCRSSDCTSHGKSCCRDYNAATVIVMNGRHLGHFKCRHPWLA